MLQTFLVVARDNTIFRFSTHEALFLLSPFNPVRRGAIIVLTHPYPFTQSRLNHGIVTDILWSSRAIGRVYVCLLPDNDF